MVQQDRAASLYFLFGIHNHQPVDNFDHVMAEGFDLCYGPLLAGLEAHPAVRMTIHHSGPLLEWIEKNRPAYLEVMLKLVERGQLEIMGGAFYEPILPAIPEQDAVDQIGFMSDYCREKFGVSPRGAWLAERIWDPRLPGLFKKSGVRYTVLDDTHFDYAGIGLEKKLGYYVTESMGHPCAVFPIDRKLRYLIPFKMPGEVIDYLREIRDACGGAGVTYADDGEKFGFWPGTHQWVFKEGWLHKFFTALEENASWITMLTFSEYMDQFDPAGRVYLPPASYEEMMTWTLDPDMAGAYQDLVDGLENRGEMDRFRPFVRGGMWDNFMAKYPESNRMHKKMLYVSRKLSQARSKCRSEAGQSRLQAAARSLWRGQCNCGYWHGLFGGLYLCHLRNAVYRHLIEADRVIDGVAGTGQVRIHREDYDADGLDEVIIESEKAAVYIHPARGGAVAELDLRTPGFNLINTLSRRREAYHEKLGEHETARREVSADRPESIHDIRGVKEEGLTDLLVYDAYERTAFLDRFIPGGLAFSGCRKGGVPERGDFLTGRYDILSMDHDPEEGTAGLDLERHGTVGAGGGRHALSVLKRYRFRAREGMLEVSWTLKPGPGDPFRCRFAVEFNFSLLTDRDPARFMTILDDRARRIPLDQEGCRKSVRELTIRDETVPLAAHFTIEKADALWWYPVRTVSQSEDGLEGTYQGSAVLFIWDCAFEPEKEESKKIILKI
jgi:alpha-amylase